MTRSKANGWVAGQASRWVKVTRCHVGWDEVLQSGTTRLICKGSCDCTPPCPSQLLTIHYMRRFLRQLPVMIVVRHVPGMPVDACSPCRADL
jgi:hypothetical protein